MNAGFFKRLSSSIVDFAMVFVFVYLIFLIGGRTVLQNRVEYFDYRYSTYSEILDVYNEDIVTAQTEYEANMEVAAGNADLEAAATDLYNLKTSMLNTQNTMDIQPYNISLTGYYLNIIYFFAFGVVFMIALLAVLTLGRTPGRRLLQIRLVTQNSQGENTKPNAVQVFFHDAILKYFFIAVVIMMSIYYGFVFIMLSLLIDMILMTFTKSKITIRDYFLRTKVVKAGYGY